MSRRAGLGAEHLVVGAGVAAALHIGKLPPAIAALQAALGLTLVEAGFLLSTVQVAGMAAGIAFGALADRLGARRALVAGLVLLAAASAAGAAASTPGALLALRAVEGFGFLLAVLPAPGLVRRLAPPERVQAVLGLWGAYMPLATALALLLGPWAVDALGWRGWWALLAALTGAAALALLRVVPADAAPTTAAGSAPAPTLSQRLAQTLTAGPPWLVAAAFGCYSSQWLAVIGFLPTVVAETGWPPAAVGALAALVAAANIAGNVGAGRLLQRGVAPPRLLAAGFAAMGLAALAAFSGDPGLPPAARYAALLAFSGCGGLVPTTLFSLAARAAPGPQALATTVGWMQQGSALGQFSGPPVVAWIAERAGGWQWTGAATASAALAGLALSAAIARWLRRGAGPDPGPGAAPGAVRSSSRP